MGKELVEWVRRLGGCREGLSHVWDGCLAHCLDGDWPG